MPAPPPQLLQSLAQRKHMRRLHANKLAKHPGICKSLLPRDSLLVFQVTKSVIHFQGDRRTANIESVLLAMIHPSGFSATDRTDALGPNKRQAKLGIPLLTPGFYSLGKLGPTIPAMKLLRYPRVSPSSSYNSPALISSFFLPLLFTTRTTAYTKALGVPHIFGVNMVLLYRHKCMDIEEGRTPLSAGSLTPIRPRRRKASSSESKGCQV